jgi:putative two-component system response regulator
MSQFDRHAAVLPSHKILIVDDDEIVRRTTSRQLTSRGYACVEAASADQARTVLDAEQDVAAVLCDIRMPGASGIDLLRQLIADFPDLAVVMMTGVDDPQVADAAFDLGAFGYVIKPFDLNELLISLASALKRRELEAAKRGQVQAMEQTIARTRLLGGVLDGLEGDPDAAVGRDDDVSERLSRAVSLRDEETGRHIERMSRYAVVLAGAVGCTELSPEDLRLAAALHDVGKIGVPDGILLKPGSLSPDEYAAMQRHAQIGYQLLAGARSDLLQAAADIALSHHEWWDGTGYPRGLQGEEISEVARIAAITDVFDALTSNRVYRPGVSFEQAIDVMRELRGRQFEPRLLDAFFESMDEIAAIRETYPDVEDVQERIRILVVDDHEIFTHSLVRLLGSRPELKVVGTAGTVSEAVVAALAYAPDVILMDFELPDGDGPQATAQIKALTPSVKVVMLTAHTDDASLVSAIAAGCSGFIRKEDAVDDLLTAIVAAHEGETIESPTDLAPLLRQLRPTHRGLGADLTPRELEVLGLMISGVGNKQIARELGLSLNTVRNHAQNILYKLQAHSKLEAVATAVREGIISYPSDGARQ